MGSSQCQKVLHVIRCLCHPPQAGKLRTGDPCACPAYFLRRFQAVVQERGSERHFSKKRQELGFGNSELARFTQCSLKEMELNLERTLKLYKWVFKTLVIWPMLMNKPHVKGKKYQTLANRTFSVLKLCYEYFMFTQQREKIHLVIFE